MNNCIFAAHCIEKTCDRSCPTLAVTSYLLERNGLNINNKVFKSPPDGLSTDKVEAILNRAKDGPRSYITSDTVSAAEFITYCAICLKWPGSQMHCNVYNLKYSTYINLSKQSWSTKQDPEELEYMRIWADNAEVLIISGIDFVNFSDFECQTLLALVQSRKSAGKSTIIVSPSTKFLVGKSNFFNRVLSLLEDNRDRGGETK